MTARKDPADRKPRSGDPNAGINRKPIILPCKHGCGFVGSARERWAHERSSWQCPAILSRGKAQIL